MLALERVKLANKAAKGKEKFLEEDTFKTEQMKQYRKMSESKMGHWYGAFLQDQLVGDLGIFHDGELGRFQVVGTRPEFRRLGICQTLVYEAALWAQRDYQIDQLVMEADAHYHAAKIYESVGFRPAEKSYALSWWSGNIDS